VPRHPIIDRTGLRAHLSAGDVMLLLDLREPINAWSHGVGMMLALPVTWVLCTRCGKLSDFADEDFRSSATRYQRVKALCLLIFGVTLITCYGTSAAFHGVRLSGQALYRLQRLDHVGIYLLIAGTYTPVAWALMRRSWWWGTMTTVWTIAILCIARVWCGGVMPIWVSTLTYLAMGWGALFCYFELAKTYSHWTLLPLPSGGVFYSVGALLNLARWPVLFPGVFAAHELFHFLVIAGSACHVFFMLKVVVPSPDPAYSRSAAAVGGQGIATRRQEAPVRMRRWLSHRAMHCPRLSGMLFGRFGMKARDELDSLVK
jgi:hemolysin III